MKLDTIVIVSAAAIAAGLVLLPKLRQRVAGAVMGPTLAVGQVNAGNVWNAGASAMYREQLARELRGQPDFWV